MTFGRIRLINLLGASITFNAAFFIPYGFLSLIGFPYFVYRLGMQTFLHGFFLGVSIFCIHFLWVLHVLWYHSQAPWWLCCIGYALFVGYCSATIGVLSWGVGMIVRRMTKFRCGIALCAAIVYLAFVEYAFFWPIGIPLGYPFLNPVLPLFECVKSAVPIRYSYVPPVTNRVINSGVWWSRYVSGVGHKVYQQLCAVQPTESLVVSPESMFPFSLNKHPECIALWSTQMRAEQNWLFGSLYTNAQGTFQVVYCLQGGLIKNFYVKKRLMPFAEYIPRVWNSCKYLRGLFVCPRGLFSVPSGTLGCDYFECDGTRLIPYVCLEFFCSSLQTFKHHREKNTPCLVLAFVNDSWFPSYFRQWMMWRVRYVALLTNLPVVYVGHFSNMKPLN